jgi:hypothetical protein
MTSSRPVSYSRGFLASVGLFLIQFFHELIKRLYQQINIFHIRNFVQ